MRDDLIAAAVVTGVFGILAAGLNARSLPSRRAAELESYANALTQLEQSRADVSEVLAVIVFLLARSERRRRNTRSRLVRSVFGGLAGIATLINLLLQFVVSSHGGYEWLWWFALLALFGYGGMYLWGSVALSRQADSLREVKNDAIDGPGT